MKQDDDNFLPMFIHPKVLMDIHMKELRIMDERKDQAFEDILITPKKSSDELH